MALAELATGHAAQYAHAFSDTLPQTPIMQRTNRRMQSEGGVDAATTSTLVGSLLSLAQHARRDHAMRGSFAALAALLRPQANGSLSYLTHLSVFLDRGGTRAAVDVLGPPPIERVLWEHQHFRMWERHVQPVQHAPQNISPASCTHHATPKQAGKPAEAAGATQLRALLPHKLHKLPSVHSRPLADASDVLKTARIAALTMPPAPVCALHNSEPASYSSLAVPLTFQTSFATKLHATELLDVLAHHCEVLPALRASRAAFRVGRGLLEAHAAKLAQGGRPCCCCVRSLISSWLHATRTCTTSDRVHAHTDHTYQGTG